jgi:hypothetical protein
MFGRASLPASVSATNVRAGDRHAASPFLEDHPEVRIYAIRLDRGMSSAEVLRSGLGAQPEADGPE